MDKRNYTRNIHLGQNFVYFLTFKTQSGTVYLIIMHMKYVLHVNLAV